MQNCSVLVSSRLQLNPPQNITPARETADKPARGYVKIALREAPHTLDNQFVGALDRRLKTLCLPLAILLIHMLVTEIVATVAMGLLSDPITETESRDIDNKSLQICGCLHRALPRRRNSGSLHS